MIANISRLKFFHTCKRKEFNFSFRHLHPKMEDLKLVTGEGWHVALADLLSGRTIEEAIHSGEKAFRDRLEGQMILPEERPEIEKQIETLQKGLRLYAGHYRFEEIQVLHPEVTFCVEIPNTYHHCWFFHRLLHPEIPFTECRGHMFHTFPMAPEDEKAEWISKFGCIQLHRLKGRTDAVISWKDMVWLLEHKTTAYDPPSYYDQWRLDLQPTGYIYGIWKALGVRPHGFILNVIKKPTKRQSADAIGFSREAYIKTEADLANFEVELIEMMNDYESFAVRSNGQDATKWYKQPGNGSCLAYNRRCYFWDACLSNDDPEVLQNAFTQREKDYVEEEYETIINRSAVGRIG